MNRPKFHVKKGDQVLVISGNHKGATGKVLEVLAKKERVLIEGVRLIKKHVRKSQDQPTGGIVEREGPIHISNVKLIERPTAAKESKPKKSKTRETKPKATKTRKSRTKKTKSKETRTKKTKTKTRSTATKRTKRTKKKK